MANTADGIAMPRDDLDDLLDYMPGNNDVFGEIDTSMDIPDLPPRRIATNDTNPIANLGIEEEVKVRKKRQPAPKLDEERLLSQAGIPKLRRITKERLKLKGKGHEFSDVSRLINLYQLWLDDLYPKAKFADGLAIIEKLGHTKRLQVMRREWIDEGKTRDPSQHQEDKEIANIMRPEDDITTKDDLVNPSNDAALPRVSSVPDATNSVRTKPASNSLFFSDEEGEDVNPDDDLDAILAEEGQQNRGSLAQVPVKEYSRDNGHDFEDDEDAMAAMDDIW
ncbi:chromosome segregation in meiosis- protein [Agyrium rufum]|nr:chromosome segregation in meiosis- protein [Agyrium rufum]